MKSKQAQEFIDARTHTDYTDKNNRGIPWQSVSKHNAIKAIELAESEILSTHIPIEKAVEAGIEAYCRNSSCVRSYETCQFLQRGEACPGLYGFKHYFLAALKPNK